MKPWRSSIQDQIEEEENEDAASETDAAQGGRVWGGDTAHERMGLPGASIAVARESGVLTQ